LVLSHILFQVLLDVWVNTDHFIQGLLVNITDVAVSFGLDSRCPPLVRQQGNLSEVSARLQDLDESIEAVLVDHPDFTFSLGDEIELLRDLPLMDDHFFRVVHF